MEYLGDVKKTSEANALGKYGSNKKNNREMQGADNGREIRNYFEGKELASSLGIGHLQTANWRSGRFSSPTFSKTPF